MRRLLGLAAALAVPVTLLAFPGGAGADHGTNPVEMSPNMVHLANRANPGETNSDLAFWNAGGTRKYPDLLFAGNYEGFRIFDIRDPENPRLITDFPCRANQGDLSVYQAKNRLLLIQSIDRPLTSDDCAALPTPVAGAEPPHHEAPPGVRFEPGFEGLRIFDVSDPELPVHISSVRTACGSHTHTTIPDKRNQRAIVYVSSYPLGAGITPMNPPVGFVGPECRPPHAKISVVEIYDDSPETPIRREVPLHADTLPFMGTVGSGGSGAVGCHDITTLQETRSSPAALANYRGQPKWQIAGASCLEEGQLWDISDPANPKTTTVPGHSHIRNPFISGGVPGTFKGLFHTTSFTWDGEVMLLTDEWGGGGAHGCDGPQDHRGNVWFYKVVPPGVEPVPTYGRYMFPRPQPAQEVCTLHNGNVIPDPDGRYLGVSAAYEGGTSVFDFTGVQENPEIVLDPFHAMEPEDVIAARGPVPVVATEIAYADMQGVDGRGRDDVWSSYWYNDYIWTNGGLGRPHNPGGRGLDVFMLLDEDGKQYKARHWNYANPQTQETHQGVGWGR